MKNTLIIQIINKIRVRFEAYGGEETRDTFNGELNYEAGRVFYLVFLVAVILLPYIPGDLVMHQNPVYIVSIKIGLTLLCLILIALRFTKYFRYKPGLLLMVMVGYLYIGSAMIMATAGDAAASYISSFALIIVIPIFLPLPLKFKITFIISTFLIFLLLSMRYDIDFSDSVIQNSFFDLIAVLVISLIMSHSLNKLRYLAWKQQKKLISTSSELEEALIEAQKADKSKSDFLATMSHEIRTPLNAILGISQLQLQNENLSDELADALGKINNSGTQLLGIINDILDMSRIETGNLELNPAKYHLPSLINDSVQLNIVRIGSKPITFDLEIDKKLPSLLYGDELRLKQILNNLLSNAIKYTEKGHIKLSITASDCTDNGGVLLRFDVSDTGQGITLKDQEHLFAEYTRFNFSANRAIEGVGLGLTIVRKLVAIMGGTIEVKSEYGVGSTFSITVLQEAVECAAIGEEITSKLRNFTYKDKNRLESTKIIYEPMPYGSVLIVDDIEINLFVAEAALEPYELQIEMASSGFETIDKIKNGSVYDIIFMDHMMPHMDGVETVAKLRELGYTGVIVALTANALVGNSEMFAQNGFDEFISKPIDFAQLDNILNKFIRRKQPD